jgi:hypothetical protein
LEVWVCRGSGGNRHPSRRQEAKKKVQENNVWRSQKWKDENSKKIRERRKWEGKVKEGLEKRICN